MNVENIDLFAGEDRTITLHARDEGNHPVNLTGKTVEWFVGPRVINGRTALFTKSGTVTVPGSGIFTVPVAAADTADIEGDYEHVAKATTTASGAIAVVVAGRFRVRPVLVS